MNGLPVGAGGFAELFVASYLQAGAGAETTLAPFVGGTIDVAAMTPGSLYVPRTAVVAAEPAGPGYWRVTVAADVLEDVSGSYVAAGVRYFEVGVTSGPSGLAVAAPPAEVPAPPHSPAPALAAPALQPPMATDPIDGVLSEFFSGLLCGGDVSRLASPGAPIVAVAPPAFDKAVLTGVAVWGSGSARLAAAAVQGSTKAGSVVVLRYEVGLALRAGRWEVSSLTGAPTLASRQGDAGGASSAAGAGS
ncbi:MAG TPA: hypothetical protein VHA73_05350 [Acidimicrobiales bacterium]|nr:hypothetical protein [Acidimicrobiales bacterium]